METVPGYVSGTFILATFASVAFLLLAVKAVGVDRLPSQILIFLLPLWILFTAVLALGGFYQPTSVSPPRVLVFAVTPALVVILGYFLLFRTTFIERIPLRLLTLSHVVRIPVELCLLWLSIAGAVPSAMTFEGRNFDILSGILSPIVWFFAFRHGKVARRLLVAYNVLGLVLLVNIVTIAVLAMPSPYQRLAVDQPNRAVAYFPYIWLPAIVVPTVLFNHLAALWKLAKSK